MPRRLSQAWLWILLAGAAGAEIIDVREGTNLALAIHPDGDFMVVDLLGGLWRMPVTGGGATPLIPSGNGIAQPRFDPSGESVVFQRWLDGQWDVWRLTLATGLLEPLAESEYNEREPEFSADGTEVVFAGDYSGRYDLWALDLDSRALAQLTDEPGDARFPSFDESGALAYVNVLANWSEVRLYAPAERGETLIASNNRLDAPSWRPGGGVLVVNERVEGRASDLGLFIDADEPIWRQLTDAEDVFVGRAAWLSPEAYAYGADGALWRRGIGSPERTRILLFAAADVDEFEPESEVPRLDASGPYPIAGINGLVHHAATGQSAFSALGDLWLVDDGSIVRLTDDDFSDASPAFSPDGTWLIFASDRGGTMDVWRRRIDSGQLLQVSDEAGHVFEPRVSEDGQFVAFLESGDRLPAGGAALKVIAFERPFMAETLATGLLEAGGLSWQGRHLLLTARDRAADARYLHVYETQAADDFAPSARSAVESLELDGHADLQWQPTRADAPFVIQVGRLFDGVGGAYRYHVDIHIEGQRITNIVGRNLAPLPERVIDARESTVVPGLVDVHTHLGRAPSAAIGQRLLAHGVTTVNVVTADWRKALELAETWASGQQPGPRVVVSPMTPIPEIAALAEAPIVIGSNRHILGGLRHALAEQWSRDGNIQSDLLLALVDTPATNTPRIALSTLGRSYADVFAQIRASRAYLATTLIAFDSSAEAERLTELTGAFARVLSSSGRVAIGTDAPAVAFGSGFHDELALLAARGMAEDQLLRFATAGGAIALGLSLETGTLAPGRLADLVVIDGNPLNDIAELKSVDGVVVRGVWHDVESNELVH